MARLAGTTWPFLLADDSDQIVGMRSGDTDRYFLLSTTPGTPNLTLDELSLVTDLGAQTRFRHYTETLTAMSGATVTATSLIPANSIVLGVTTRVITDLVGPTSIDIGYGSGGNLHAFGNNVANLTADSVTNIADFSQTSPHYFGAATNVVITANGGNFTAGAMRVTAHYITLLPVTS